MKNFLCILMMLLIASLTASPVELWKEYDPDKGDFKEEIVSEKTESGIYYRDSYISAYVNGEEIRVYCKYAVKANSVNAPGLMDVHGWMAKANPDFNYLKDGWAVMAHDYCGKATGRQDYTKYPESMKYCNMDRAISGGAIISKLPNGSDITDPKQTSDYVWYAIQRRVLSYLLAQKEVDKNRIGAKGYSYGGTIMWNLATDKRVKAVVAFFGVGYLEYFRSKAVWKYNLNTNIPAKTKGEELYTSTIAPQSHSPYITAATLWLNGSNDHHGGHERGEEIFLEFKKDVPWSFAHQARGHHNTEKLGDDCKLWLEKYVLGKDINWPARPQSTIKLNDNGVPVFELEIAQADFADSVEAYYALKEPNSYNRTWFDVILTRNGDKFTGELPVAEITDYVFAFANIKYKNNIVISSDFTAAIPEKLGKAVATFKVDPNDISILWQGSAPVEGVGGIMGFRSTNKHQGVTNTMYASKQFKAPKNAELYFKFYCTQPQDIILKANDHFVKTISIPASNEWQSMTVDANDVVFVNDSNNKISTWDRVYKIQFVSAPNNDLTKVIFADIKWQTPALKATGDKTYLNSKNATVVDSFWRVMEDKAVSDVPISIGSKTFEKGIGVHSPSKIEYSLGGQFKTFTVTAGPDNGHAGTICMKILVDGKEVFTTGSVRKYGFVEKETIIDVTNANSLTLIVEDIDNNKGGDHASWGDAYLTK